MKCASPYCHQSFIQPDTGRKRAYCSDACKMVDYRIRRNAAAEVERKRQEVEHRLAEQRRTEQRHARRIEQVEHVVQHALAVAIKPNSRVSTTQQRSLAEQITRQLQLASLIDLP